AVYQFLDAGDVIGIGPAHFPAEILERMAELVDRPAIELARRDEVVAALHEGMEDEKLRRVTRGGGERGGAAFERGNALLEHALGRVHDARVDIAELLQAEQRRGMAGIIEYVGSGLVDRRDPRLGGRIRLCTCMDGERVETWRALRHVPLSFDL